MNKNVEQWLRISQLIAIATSTVALPYSVFLCHAGMLIFLLLWAFEGNWSAKLRVVQTSILLQSLIAFFLVLLIGIFYSDFKSIGWNDIQQKIFLLLLPIALATTRFKWTEKQLRFVLKSFVMSCLLACVICTLNATSQVLGVPLTPANISYLSSSNLVDLRTIPSTWMYFSYINLAGGINIHPAYLSLYIGFSILLILHELFEPGNRSQKKLLLVSILLFLLVFEIFLSVRIVVFTLVAMLIVISIFFGAKAKRSQRSIMIPAIVAMVLFSIWLNPITYYRNVQEIEKSNFTIKENSLYRTSAEIRASLWWLSWKAYQNNNPILGSGTGSVKAKVQEQSENLHVKNVVQSNDPHNQFLYVLIGNGLIGLLLFLFCLVLPLRIALVEKDYLYLGFLFLCGALFVTESALELQKGIAFIAIMFPLLSFQRKAYQDNFYRKVFSVRN